MATNGGPSQPPGPHLNTPWIPAPHPHPERPYEGYDDLSFRQTAPGESTILWQPTPNMGQNTDTTSFTALLNSPLDLSATNSPMTGSPMMSPPTMSPPMMSPPVMNPPTMSPPTMSSPTMSPPMMSPPVMNPQMMNPSVVNPQMMSPQMMNPQTMNPQMMNSQIMHPQIMHPQMMHPQMMNPQMMRPQMMRPQMMRPQMMRPQMMNSQMMNRQMMNPQMMNPQMMNPSVVNRQMMNPPGGDDQARAARLHQVHNFTRPNEPAHLQHHAAPPHRPSMPRLLAPPDEAQPLPKRQRGSRAGSGRLPLFLREMQADHAKMAAEREAAAAAAANPGSSTVDLTTVNDPPKRVDPKEEEVCYGMIKTRANCTQVPSPKPGTQSMWGPQFQPSIKVILRRPADDDSWRIPVCDHTRAIIGQVDMSASRALAPLLDFNIRVRTDCRIPPQPATEGEEPGQAVSRSYRLDIVLYGPFKYAKNVGAILERNHVPLHQPYILQKGIKFCNPHARDFARVTKKQLSRANANREGDRSRSSNLTPRTVEEVRSEVMGVFDSLTRSDELPTMDPPTSIVTPLLTHQKQGLYFMMTREKPREVQLQQKGMVSFWRTKPNFNGQIVYHNVITGESQVVPPSDTRGGILADMMGLGKTLSILSLVATTMDEARQFQHLPPEQPSAPETRQAKRDLEAAQAPLGLTALTRNTKSTLIICPLSTITNWEEQIKQHTANGQLSYHIYHGPNRIKDVERLAQFDIVITTYGSVSNELSSRRRAKSGSFPLEELGWFRIVLDEAHMIREQSTMQFKAIVRLQAQRRWAVTGTPVQNRLDDFAALLSFIRLEPFHQRAKFLRHIVEPFKACNPEIVPKLRILVDTVTLRRLKDKIDLPSREDFIVRLDFSPEERGIYDLFARNAQDRVKALAGNPTSGALGGNTYIHILKAILRLRLLCAHGKDLLNKEDLAALKGMSAELAIDIDENDENAEGAPLSHQKAHEMFTLMQDTNNDACIQCNKKISQEQNSMDAETEEDTLGYMTPCFHVVCQSCIRSFKQRAKAALAPGQLAGPCIVCSAHVRFGFVNIRRSDVEGEHDGILKTTNKSKEAGTDMYKYDGPHTKTKALLEDLLKSKAASDANPQEAPFKSVVFSGWTSHLDLIERALKEADIRFTRLDGSMTRQARTAAMDTFREDRNIHVILVSITAGGLGLNLTAGNNVYVMEPQYNPAAEAQAIDRVHRLGQKRPVRTIRYIMRSSFEEKMLELQDKKVKLASLSMDGQNKALDKAEAARQKLMDLRSLFK
ncbi:SNF2 family N-terminal domain-containing protein [Trichoderma gracile]